MAGSYQHCCGWKDTDSEENDPKHDNTFTFQLIENMGDAHEACEHMHFMLYWMMTRPAATIEEASETYFKWIHATTDERKKMTDWRRMNDD